MKQMTALQLALAGVLTVGAAQAQSVKTQERANSDAPIPAIQDWSSRSVISGKPMLPDEFIAAGRTAEMEKRYRDPRYVAGVLRRIEAEMPLAPAMHQRSAPLASAVAKAASDRRRGHGGADPEVYDSLVHRDWSNVLGNGNGGSGPLGVYPAKYNFDLFAGPSCADDFVVYGTNAASRSQSIGGTSETTALVMSGGDPSGTITLGTAPRSVTLTASAAPANNLQFLNTGTDTVQAAALAAAVNVWSQQTGVTATSSGATVTFARIGTGDTDAIAVANSLTNFGGAAAIVNGTGTSGQPSILAFNQLYNTTCNAGRSNPNAPNVMWAYNTSTVAAPNAIVETSPVLSYYDSGKQVAYIQRSGNVLQLVLLKWQAGNGTAANPLAITPVASAAAYRACASNCFFAITLSGTTNTGNGPTYSSPYVDYTNDLIWVGDGNSQLHKFTGVFQGNPAEVTTGGFPATVATAGLDLSPAVADDNFVYIGSQSGATAADGGRIHRVTASNGTVVSSAKLYADARNGFRAPMILDTGFNRLNTFSFSHPGTITDASLCTHTAPTYVFCRAVVQFDTTNFTAGTSGTKREIGLGSITGENVVLWMGAFDDAYYSSGTGTGAMYMCGGSLPRTQQTYLWKVPYTNGVMGLPIIGPQIGQDDNDTDTVIYNCSPPTVIKNGSNEYLYVSVSGAGLPFASAPGCGNATDTNPLSACMYMFNLNDLSNTAGTSETWVFTFANTNGGNSQTASGETIVIGGVTLTTAANNTGLNFNISGNRNADRDSLVAKINSSVPGYTSTAGGNGVVNITRTAIGDAPAITEGLTDLSQTSNTQGTNPDIVWSSAAIPRAALQVIGGTGGIIVDNVQNATTGAQQIYTTQSGTVGNAVQASQSGLQ